jgi:hypothetical protein
VFFFCLRQRTCAARKFDVVTSASNQLARRLFVFTLLRMGCSRYGARPTSFPNGELKVQRRKVTSPSARISHVRQPRRAPSATTTAPSIDWYDYSGLCVLTHTIFDVAVLVGCCSRAHRMAWLLEPSFVFRAHGGDRCWTRAGCARSCNVFLPQACVMVFTHQIGSTVLRKHFHFTAAAHIVATTLSVLFVVSLSHELLR